jgi:hypothetical protein
MSNIDKSIPARYRSSKYNKVLLVCTLGTRRWPIVAEFVTMIIIIIIIIRRYAVTFSLFIIINIIIFIITIVAVDKVLRNISSAICFKS